MNLGKLTIFKALVRIDFSILLRLDEVRPINLAFRVLIRQLA